MNTNTPTKPRPQLETLACVNEGCELYGQAGQHNLTARIQLVLFTDGDARYASRFPEIVDQP